MSGCGSSPRADLHRLTRGSDLPPPSPPGRVRKLKETLVTVQQLDKKMSNLRTWLSRMEAALAEPLVYSVCHSDEIKRQLAAQQVGPPPPKKKKKSETNANICAKLSTILFLKLFISVMMRYM